MDPIDYLAALGLLSVARRAELQWVTEEARSCDVPVPQHAEVSMPTSELTDVVLSDAAAAAADIEGIVQHAVLHVRDVLAPPLLPAVGLDMLSGQQSLTSAGRRLAESMTAADVAALHDDSVPRSRTLSGASLRLSATDGRTHAYQAVRPAATVAKVRVAASWLAWRAITSFPWLGWSWRGSALARARHLTWHTPGGVFGWHAAKYAAIGGFPGWNWRSRITWDRYGYGSLSPAEPVFFPSGGPH